jgi:Uma2 family endonuclease
MSLAYRSQLPPLLTFADFVDWPGDGTGNRYELIDGVLRAMAPASDAHNRIVINAVFLIETHLRDRKMPCRVVATPGVRPLVRSDWNFRIPDLGVTCTPNRPSDLVIPNPVVLIEVLSPSNANETWEAVRAYATIPSVQEILIVHSTKIMAELLRRDAQNNWPADPAPVGRDGHVRIQSIDAEWPLTEYYDRTHLLTSDEEPK